MLQQQSAAGLAAAASAVEHCLLLANIYRMDSSPGPQTVRFFRNLCIQPAYAVARFCDSRVQRAAATSCQCPSAAGHARCCTPSSGFQLLHVDDVPEQHCGVPLGIFQVVKFACRWSGGDSSANENLSSIVNALHEEGFTNTQPISVRCCLQRSYWLQREQMNSSEVRMHQSVQKFIRYP